MTSQIPSIPAALASASNATKVSSATSVPPERTG